MNTRQLLDKTLYPQAGQNARRKEYAYFDTATLTTGTLEYFFFNTPLGDIFSRNKKLPLSGTEVFLVDNISAYISTSINTPALIDSLNELLQQSYLLISIDNRQVMKIPGLDFIQYNLTLTEGSTPQAITYKLEKIKRKLPLPILMNSTSSFQFKFVTTAAAATAFNTVPFRLSLGGVQIDKLESFYYNDLKNNQFQQVAVTYYDNATIASGAQAEYQFFANPAKAQNLLSQTFPLSNIQTFSLQNIEVFVNQPDTPIVPLTILNSRLTNNLKITVNDVDFYNGNLQECLSVVAGYAGNITDSGGATIAYNMFMSVRQSKTFKVPLEIPTNSNVQVTLNQPASSLGITGEITIALRGVETRRVA